MPTKIQEHSPYKVMRYDCETSAYSAIVLGTLVLSRDLQHLFSELRSDLKCRNLVRHSRMRPQKSSGSERRRILMNWFQIVLFLRALPNEYTNRDVGRCVGSDDSVAMYLSSLRRKVSGSVHNAKVPDNS